MYDFDKVIDRTGTESTKWERYKEIYQRDDLLPLWLADMDLPTSKEIQDALMKRAMHPIYGYSDRGLQYYEVFAQRFREKFKYEVNAEDVILSTGVIYSITAAIHVFTNPDDGILVPMPCYHPFIDCVENSGRRAIKVEMNEQQQFYTMDIDGMERVMDDSVKAIILCNPHNPTGRVFSEEELRQLSAFCERHGLFIISDEIHSDFIYETAFIPIMNVSEYAKVHTIACVSPTKAFNLAGVKVSAIFLKNKEMKEKLKSYCSLIGISSINIFAMEALKAAYVKSAIWQREVLAYLAENRKMVEIFVTAHAKYIQAISPQGTYFYWLRFSENIHDELITKAGIVCSDGSTFGEAYAMYERLNFACPREMLEKALHKLDAYLQQM